MSSLLFALDDLPKIRAEAASLRAKLTRYEAILQQMETLEESNMREFEVVEKGLLQQMRQKIINQSHTLSDLHHAMARRKQELESLERKHIKAIEHIKQFYQRELDKIQENAYTKRRPSTEGGGGFFG
mgnify:CR=1 FL=1